jgi:hypothetical protein
MSTATILLTGPRLPYHVLDYAINWAKDNEGAIRALFLVPSDLPEEGYPFPNDLDEAENMTHDKDAEQGVRVILQDQIRFIEKRCMASHVPVATELMFSPSVKKVVARIQDSEVIFVDKNIEENEDDMSDLPFTIDDITDKVSKHMIQVGEMDSYSDVVY